MSKATPLTDVVSFLDDFLRLDQVPDYGNAVNGLQVDNTGTVDHLVAAVDAGQLTIDSAAASSKGPALVLVHHGLLWDGNVAVTGRRFRRLKTLMDHDLALYAAHLPLDVHPEVGNNVQLARLLQLPITDWFGEFQGVPLGVRGELAIERTDLVARLNDGLRTEATLLAGGPPTCRQIGIITGGAGDMIGQAVAAGCDTFITGEGAHHTFFDAHEWAVNVIYAGHYATEQLGVQALAAVVSERFDLPWEFHDHPTGL